MNNRKLLVMAIVFVSGCFVYFLWHKSQGLNGSSATGKDSAACEQAKTKINQVLKKMNYCTESSDCTLVNGCPFGCSILINKDADWSELSESGQAISEKCGECDLVCGGAFRTGEVFCEDGRCVGRKK